MSRAELPGVRFLHRGASALVTIAVSATAAAVASLSRALHRCEALVGRGECRLESGKKAEALEDATVVALPVLYVILNAVLFGLPMLKTPRSMPKERKFIPWKQIKKVNPWAADLSDVQDEEAEEESEEARVSTAAANKGSASGPFTALRRQHSSGARRSAKQLI